jgi:hypothetical protein
MKRGPNRIILWLFRAGEKEFRPTPGNIIGYNDRPDANDSDVLPSIKTPGRIN